MAFTEMRETLLRLSQLNAFTPPTITSLLLIYLPLTILTSVTSLFIYRLYFHPLSHIPGPILPALTTLFRVHEMSKGAINTYERALHKKYGPIVRIGPNLISSNDPEHISLIHHSQVDKPAFLDMPGLGLEHGVVATRGWRKHREVKRRLMNPYSNSILLLSEHRVDKHVVSFAQQLDRLFGEKGEPFDLANWGQYFAFDVVSEISFGRAQGFLEAGMDKGGLIQATKETVKMGFLVVALAGSIYNLYKSLPERIAQAVFVPNMKGDRGIGVMLKTAKDLVDETRVKLEARKKGGVEDEGKAKSFVERIMDLKEPDGTPVSDDYIVSELCATMIGGADTTAATLRHFFDLLHSHPPVLTKLLSELDTAYASLPTPTPVLPFPIVSSLPYLTACIKEAQRLIQPTGNLTPRCVSPPGLTLSGVYIPAGFEIGQNPWVLGRSESFYGDPDVFMPERWLVSEEERRRLERGDATWGFGPRGCVGRNLAMMELWKVGAGLLRLFRFEKVGEERQHLKQFGFWEAEGFWFKVERREVPEWDLLDREV